MGSPVIEILSNASLFAVWPPRLTEGSTATYDPALYCTDSFFEILHVVLTCAFVTGELPSEYVHPVVRFSFVIFYVPYLYKGLVAAVQGINYCSLVGVRAITANRGEKGPI